VFLGRPVVFETFVVEYRIVHEMVYKHISTGSNCRLGHWKEADRIAILEEYFEIHKFLTEFRFVFQNRVYISLQNMNNHLCREEYAGTAILKICDPNTNPGILISYLIKRCRIVRMG